jgi:carbamoyl-phosphate synthase large subunit
MVRALRSSKLAVWRERLRRFAGGESSVAEFCRQEGVSAPSFYLWRKRLGKAQAATKAAAKAMVGVSLPAQGFDREPIPSHVSVKEAVFPFAKFAGVDVVLGPEMKSTGEVMGVSERFSIAFAKSQLAAGTVLPRGGKVFISVAERAKDQVIGLAQRLEKMGFVILATRGTAERLEQAGVRVVRVLKLSQGHPNVLDYVLNGDLQLVINTPSGKGARTDEGRIRASAVSRGIPCITTIQAADAAILAMEAERQEEMTVQAIQDRFPKK